MGVATGVLCRSNARIFSASLILPLLMSKDRNQFSPDDNATSMTTMITGHSLKQPEEPAKKGDRF
jgi:hypothetical protein